MLSGTAKNKSSSVYMLFEKKNNIICVLIFFFENYMYMCQLKSIFFIDWITFFEKYDYCCCYLSIFEQIDTVQYLSNGIHIWNYTIVYGLYTIYMQRVNIYIFSQKWRTTTNTHTPDTLLYSIELNTYRGVCIVSGFI